MSESAVAAAKHHGFKMPELAELLSTMTVMEAVELTRLLEEKWGVSADVQVAPATQTTVVPDAVVEEQTEFQIVLIGLIAADKKISVIKEIRTITGLGLKEAKEFVENPPKQVRESATKAEADQIKDTLEKAGGVVEIK